MAEKVRAKNKHTGEIVYQYPHIIEMFDNLTLTPSERSKAETTTTTKKEATK